MIGVIIAQIITFIFDCVGIYATYSQEKYKISILLGFYAGIVLMNLIWIIIRAIEKNNGDS